MVAHEDLVGGDGKGDAVLFEAEGAIVAGQVGVDCGSGSFGVEDLFVWDSHVELYSVTDMIECCVVKVYRGKLSHRFISGRSQLGYTLEEGLAGTSADIKVTDIFVEGMIRA